MALNKFAVKTKTSKTGYTKKQPQIRNGLLTFSAAFLGVIIGITAVLAVALPMINSEFAMQTKQLSQRLVSMVPANAVVSACVQPTSSTSSGGEILGASTSAVTTPSLPVSPATAPSTTFVSELVSGVLAHTTATISDTGPQSSNSIATTNTNTTTVTNTNDINVSSNNNQTAKSGNATTNNNTTGGSATSGNVANSNSNSPTIDINN